MHLIFCEERGAETKSSLQRTEHDLCKFAIISHFAKVLFWSWDIIIRYTHWINTNLLLYYWNCTLHSLISCLLSHAVFQFPSLPQASQQSHFQYMHNYYTFQTNIYLQYMQHLLYLSIWYLLYLLSPSSMICIDPFPAVHTAWLLLQ